MNCLGLIYEIAYLNKLMNMTQWLCVSMQNPFDDLSCKLNMNIWNLLIFVLVEIVNVFNVSLLIFFEVYVLFENNCNYVYTFNHKSELVLMFVTMHMLLYRFYRPSNICIWKQKCEGCTTLQTYNSVIPPIQWTYCRQTSHRLCCW